MENLFCHLMFNIFHSTLVRGIIYPYSLAVERCKVKSWTGLFVPLSDFQLPCWKLQLWVANRFCKWWPTDPSRMSVNNCRSIQSVCIRVWQIWGLTEIFKFPRMCCPTICLCQRHNVSGPWLLLEHWDTWAQLLNFPFKQYIQILPLILHPLGI